MTSVPAPEKLAIVFGPLTRLGSAWLHLASAEAFDTCLVARHEKDAARIRAAWPKARIMMAGDAPAVWPSGYRQVVVCGCAVGLIHPRKADWAADVAAADRDIRLHEQILEAYRTVPVHVIYISSVLALSPRGTAHYGGWKNVLLGTLAALIAERPNAWLSVLYPGRLIERRTIARPLSLTSTTFDQLAARLGRMALSERSSRRVIGLDAHLWLMLRGMPTWLATLPKASKD